MSDPRTPRAAGHHLPAEWEPHEAVWVAWPSHDALWAQLLGDAQREMIALCEAIADLDDDGHPRGETVRMLVPDGVRHLEAAEALEPLGVSFARVPFGDIWMRDVAPIFVRNGDGDVAAACFAFNGWGGKYILDGDDLVAPRIGELVGAEIFAFGFVLEGGAIEPDGRGTILTTRQCVLNDNRGAMDQATIEARLGEAFDARKVLWLERGLLNDHTDGHVDTLARFVEPGRVVCMEARGDDDPNREVLEEIASSLAEMTDADGRRLQVERIPSPGRVLDHEDLVMPASYANFYIANTTVVVPTYGSPHDDEAVEAIGALFPERRVVGASAKAILTGGGAFHCVTQQQPRGAVQ